MKMYGALSKLPTVEEKQRKQTKLDTTVEMDIRPVNFSDAGGGELAEDDVKEEELEQLEAEVKGLADKILHLRRTVPSTFRAKLESLLVGMRPVFPHLQQHSFDKTTSSEDGSHKRQGASTLFAALGGGEGGEEEEDQETAAQIALLKSKIAANVASMPALLDRMKLCVEKMNKLDQYKGNIHYAFTRKLPSDG